MSFMRERTARLEQIRDVNIVATAITAGSESSGGIYRRLFTEPIDSPANSADRR